MVELIEHYSNYQHFCYDQVFWGGGGEKKKKNIYNFNIFFFFFFFCCWGGGGGGGAACVCLTILQLMIAFIYQLSVGIFLM